MSAKKVSNSIVKGRSIENLMNMSSTEFMSLTRSELAVVTSRLASAGNKRLRRLEKSNEPTTLIDTYKQFSVKGKNISELRKEFHRAKAFLSRKTSKVSELRKYNEWMKTRFQGMNDEQIKKFWETFDDLKETYPDFVTRHYNEIQEQITDILGTSPEMDLNDLFYTMNDFIDTSYEQEQGGMWNEL